MSERLQPGTVTRAVVEEDGEWVGFTVQLFDGAVLWVGEVSEHLLARHGINRQADGWWAVIHRTTSSTVIGQVADRDSADALVELVSSAVGGLWRQLSERAAMDFFNVPGGGTIHGDTDTVSAVAYALGQADGQKARIAELEAECTRLRAALAVSKDPCRYCQLPAEDMAKCAAGFPGCDRADDIAGCPEFGGMMEAEILRGICGTAAAFIEELADGKHNASTMRSVVLGIRQKAGLLKTPPTNPNDRGDEADVAPR